MAALTEPELISLSLAPYSGETLKRKYRALFEWWAWCIDAGIHLLAATRPVIEQWAKHLRGRGLKPSTIAGKLGEVRLFYRWAFEEGYTERDLAAFVRVPARPRRSRLRWLSRDQAAEALRLSRELGPPWDLATHLLLLNGLRVTETLQARVEDVETVEEYTVLRLDGRKGGVLDRLALPPATVELLAGNIAGRSRGVLLVEGEKPLTRARLYAVLDRLSANAGLEFRIRPHMLRATFVTLALDAGVDPRDVMASTGHARVEMVAYYDRAHAAIRRNAGPRLAEYLEP